MFTVLACAVGYPGALPYAGPVCPTPEEAVEGWLVLTEANGTPAASVEEDRALLLAAGVGEAVYILGGDEVLVITDLTKPG